MRRVDLTPYLTHLPTPVDEENPAGRFQFDVKNSLHVVLFSGGFPAADLVKRGRLAERLDASNGHIDLEDTQWEWCRDGLEAYMAQQQRQGRVIGREFAEFARRILEAEEP
jgi:hypothetical protein